MEKLNIISGALFFMADVFAIASLSMPNWITTNIGEGNTKIGLLQTCFQYAYNNYTEECFMQPVIRPEWVVSFIAICGGIVLITVTIGLLIATYYQYKVVKVARWLGFSAMVCFCLAAVLFPVGFDMDLIGGKAYQLPTSYTVGISYIFFILSLWITVISELFAGKVCLPHF